MPVHDDEITGGQDILLVDDRIGRNLHSGAMADLFFDQALLPEGWARDVLVRVDEGGWIVDIDEGARPEGARHVPGVAVPGVPNVHSHAFQRAMAGLTERGSPGGDTFWSWRARMYDFLRALDPDAVERIAGQLFVELLERGFTSVAEFHYLRNDPRGRPYADPVEMGRRVLTSAERCGMGLTMLPTLYLASDFGAAPPSREQARFVASVEELVGDIAVLESGASAGSTGSTRVGLGLHSLRAVPAEDLTAVVEAVRAMDASTPIHIHVAEQTREVDVCVAATGSRPVAWLLDNAPVDRHWCLVHATHVDEQEIASMAASRAVVGLCPTTEANLGDGLFPLAAYASAGGAWAIGTDSHVGRSPAMELRTLEYGQRLVTRTRNVGAGRAARSTGRALLDAAWSGGAQACGRPIGSLAPGSRADIVILDPDHPALVGRSGDELLDSWVFSGDANPVREVLTGGRTVVRDGHHLLRQEIAEEYRAVARHLAGASPQPDFGSDPD